jgi:hypothetical protein
MANPNIVGITTVFGKTAAIALADTNQTTVLSNAASSEKVFKINSIIVANVDGSSAADITISYHSEDDGGGTEYKIASTVSVAADSTLVVVDKASSIYLEEDKSITATASAGGDLHVICSYEDIQD